MLRGRHPPGRRRPTHVPATATTGAPLTTLPYGAWPSPIAPADLAGGRTVLDQLTVAGDRLLWTELRPAEGGRAAPVAWSESTGRVELGPHDLDVRTRVYEYGGGALSGDADRTFVSRASDQRLVRVDGDEQTPIGPDPDPVPRDPDGARGGTVSVRWGDGQLTADGAWWIGVRESHRDDREEPLDELVALELVSGEVTVLVTDRDFVHSPRLSPDGRQLAWLAWDHPHMPSDAAELWTAELDAGVLRGARRVRGSRGDAANSPVWTSDGRLVCSFDGDGFWDPHEVTDGGTRRIAHLGGDAGIPLWTLGESALAALPAGELAAIVWTRARPRLVRLTREGVGTTVVEGFARLRALRTWGDGVAMIATARDGGQAIVTWTADDGLITRRGVPSTLRPGDLGPIEDVEVTLPDGSRTHAFLHLPANADVDAATDEAPPLLVFVHGGPTSHATPGAHPPLAFWTTRGFAVADVNHRGSSGFGRRYREELRGRWGELDVADVCAVAAELGRRGTVDADRMAIRGGSAGGFTTMAALTAPGQPFACGASFFGVADLELLAAHTHKYESRYLDGLLGPLPDARHVYRARSPLHRADHLERPLLVLQGQDDPVVPVEQADAIVAAAHARGVPHAYRVFADEKHGFRHATTIVAWHEAELSFYGQILGFAPHGDLPHLRIVRPAPRQPGRTTGDDDGT